MITPFKYLDLENHLLITNKLKYLLLNSLYLNLTETSDFLFKFSSYRSDQKIYDIHKHKNFWNFIDSENLFFAVPELKEVLQQNKIFPKVTNLIVIKKGYGLLHTDAGSRYPSLRINWPVYNCDDRIKTVFYKLKSNKEQSVNFYKVPNSEMFSQTKTALYDESDIDFEIGHYILNKPVLFDYSVPHKVLHIDSDEIQYPRVLLSIDFESEHVKL